MQPAPPVDPSGAPEGRAGAAPTVPTIAELDALPESEFTAAVTPLFEGAPRYLARLARARPFAALATFLARAEQIALGLPEDEAIELVNAHPRLGAPPASVSALSFVEQGYDRDTAERLGAEAEVERARVARELERLNAAYEERFGFRYCVFVAGRPRAELLPAMEAALGRDRELELRRALVDVVRIAEDRYRKLQPGEWR